MVSCVEHGFIYSVIHTEFRVSYLSFYLFYVLFRFFCQVTVNTFFGE